MEKIILLSPKTLRVLLVEDEQNVKWQPQFAEAILIKGVSPSAVATILTNLLFVKSGENEKKLINEKLAGNGLHGLPQKKCAIWA